MGRTRTLSNLRADVRKAADIENALDRHPDESIDRYLNQGGAALRDLMIEVRGRPFFRKEPPFSITTSSSTTRYALPTDFLTLLSVRDADSGRMLSAFQPQDEGALRYAYQSLALPLFYELQPGYIELLPKHSAGRTIVVDYIPVYSDMVGDDAPFEGFDGWEDFPVAWACREVGFRDALPDLVALSGQKLAELEKRIRMLAPKRDQYKPERVKNNRGSFGLRLPRGRW